MIKLDIVNLVADKTGVPKQKAEQVVDSLFNAMKDALAKGKRIELRGFGVFVVKPRKRGVGRNPRDGNIMPSRLRFFCLVVFRCLNSIRNPSIISTQSHFAPAQGRG